MRLAVEMERGDGAGHGDGFMPRILAGKRGFAGSEVSKEGLKHNWRSNILTVPVFSREVNNNQSTICLKSLTSSRNSKRRPSESAPNPLPARSSTLDSEAEAL